MDLNIPELAQDSIVLGIIVTLISYILIKLKGKEIRQIQPDQSSINKLPKIPSETMTVIKESFPDEKQGQIINAIHKRLKETENILKKQKADKAIIENFKNGEFDEAERVLSKDLSGKAKKAAVASYYIGNIKFAELDFDEAMQYYRKTATLTPKNPNFLNEIGSAHYLAGYYKDAILYFEQALPLFQKSYGKIHPQVAAVLNNLGETWHELNNLEKAREFIKLAYDMYVETLGKQHPHTMQVGRNLSALYL